MARISPATNRDEWPTRLFKLRGFVRVDVKYNSMWDRMEVIVARRTDDIDAARIELPSDYRTMTLEAFRHWVDAEVEKLSGSTDFPAISFNNVVPT